MFTRLPSSRFCNESWTSSILQPSQRRRPSRELDSIREPPSTVLLSVVRNPVVPYSVFPITDNRSRGASRRPSRGPWSVILWSGEPPLRPLTSHASRLDAFLLLIRPFKLDGVTKHLLKAPRANVTDFSIGIVIPTRPRDRIGDCLTQLMRTGCG